MVEEVKEEADGASGVKMSGGESLSVSVTIGGNVGGFGRARGIRVLT